MAKEKGGLFLTTGKIYERDLFDASAWKSKAQELQASPIYQGVDIPGDVPLVFFANSQGMKFQPFKIVDIEVYSVPRIGDAVLEGVELSEEARAFLETYGGMLTGFSDEMLATNILRTSTK